MHAYAHVLARGAIILIKLSKYTVIRQREKTLVYGDDWADVWNSGALETWRAYPQCISCGVRCAPSSWPTDTEAFSIHQTRPIARHRAWSRWRRDERGGEAWPSQESLLWSHRHKASECPRNHRNFTGCISPGKWHKYPDTGFRRMRVLKPCGWPGKTVLEPLTESSSHQAREPSMKRCAEPAPQTSLCVTVWPGLSV